MLCSFAKYVRISHRWPLLNHVMHMTMHGLITKGMSCTCNIPYSPDWWRLFTTSILRWPSCGASYTSTSRYVLHNIMLMCMFCIWRPEVTTWTDTFVCTWVLERVCRRRINRFFTQSCMSACTMSMYPLYAVWLQHPHYAFNTHEVVYGEINIDEYNHNIRYDI